MVEFKASFNSPNEMDAQFEDDEQFRTGLGEVIEAAGAVRYDREQDLTDEEKARARQNIGVTDNATGTLEMNLNSMTLDGGKIAYLFIASNVANAEELVELNPATVRLYYAGKYLIFNPPYQKSITGTIKRTAEDWSTYTLDFGELGRVNNTGTLSVRIPQAMMSRFTATGADELTLRAWAQTFSSETQAQMRTNIGAASENDLTTHSSDASIHFTGTEKADVQQEITDLQPFVVRATAITGSAYFNLDKTYSEILAAILAGKRVYIDTQEEVFPYTTIVSLSGMTMIIFGATVSSGNNLVTRGIAVAQNVAMRVNYTSGLVTSVNGNDGDVILDATQIGAVPANTVGIAGGVASLDASGKVPAGQLPSIPTRTSDLTNDSGFITGINASDVTGALGYTPYNSTNPNGYVNATQAANAAPVQSVNGNTGSVNLTAADVGALPDTTPIPSKTSDLTNDSGFVTETAVDTKLETKADSVGASANYAAKLTASIPYGKVDSTSTSTAYTATVSGITELKDGVCMLLYNGVVTSASGFTINVNGLGAKPSYSNMAMGNPVTPTSPTRDTTIFNINYAFLFVYSETLVSGGCWIGYRGYDANTNTIGYQIRTNSYSLPMKSITYRYRLLFTSGDGAHFVPATNSTSTNATSSRTVCQDPIDPFGTIVYYGATASVAAGSRPSATVLWQEYTLSLGYSFNRTGAALTLTSWKPVYVKCAPQSDGSAIIDSTTPYVQDLPTTNDGKIYIFLGVAYSATNIELNLDHPVYYHDGTGIKLWTGSTGGSYTETDPTVPAWAKAPTKPTYTAAEVGAQVAPLVGQINDNTASDYLTPAQVFAAVAAGRQVFASTSYLSAPLVFSAFNSGVDANSGNAIVIANLCYSLIMLALLGDVTSGVWNISAQVLVNDTIYGQIPSTTSQLTNDSGYITLADLPIWDGGVS